MRCLSKIEKLIASNILRTTPTGYLKDEFRGISKLKFITGVVLIIEFQCTGTHFKNSLNDRIRFWTLVGAEF